MKCPHCRIFFHDEWSSFGPFIVDCEARFQIKHAICASCKRAIIRINRSPYDHATGNVSRAGIAIVYPRASARPVAKEVDEKFAKDFREACLVLADSEAASAALSRRCLQNLLQEKEGTKSRDLSKQIQEILDSGKLPSHLGQAIDAVRATGNFAAHPIKSTNTGEVIDVEPGEAEWNPGYLRGAFRFLLRPASEVG